MSSEATPLVAPLMCLGALLTVGSAEAEEVEVLKVTVGKPTRLSSLTYQNTATAAVSRTGVVAAFYPKPGKGPFFYRTSKDGGETWGAEMKLPEIGGGGACHVALRDGGVLKYTTVGTKYLGEKWFRTAPMEGEFKDGWFTLHSTFAWFNDDFTKFELAPVKVYMPDAVSKREGGRVWPFFDGRIIQLDNGDLLAPMYGMFKGDKGSRVVLSRSSDRGHTWRYHATVAVLKDDPNPELPGDFSHGACEPSIASLPNGQMLCMIRTQHSHLPAQYRPMYVCWSDDVGKTWTKPVPTKPHLMNIWPTLQVLDNGVVACIYGRPGFHVAFSLDNGHTWQDRVSFSHLPEPVITGQVDGVKVRANKLVAIGATERGTCVFPVTVKRMKVSPARVALMGRVLDEKGKPIAGATVERSPNRYRADSWEEGTKLDPWKIGPVIIGSPVLGYRSIQKQNGHPTATSNQQGRFRFESVKLGELILTVEADGYAPQCRRFKVGPEPDANSAEFSLKPGKAVRSRIVDSEGKPVSGASVVLNMWHVYSNRDGSFDWSVEAPIPRQVALKVYRRYDARYERYEGTLELSRIEKQPIVLKKK